MQLSTGVLTRAVLAREVTHVAGFMQRHATSAAYMFGVACKVPLDDQWIKVPVGVGQTDTKVEELVRDAKFFLGDSDLHLSGIDDRFNFLLCHESYVHFEFDVAELLEEVRSDWTKRGFSVIELKRQN